MTGAIRAIWEIMRKELTLRSLLHRPFIMLVLSTSMFRTILAVLSTSTRPCESANFTWASLQLSQRAFKSSLTLSRIKSSVILLLCIRKASQEMAQSRHRSGDNSIKWQTNTPVYLLYLCEWMTTCRRCRQFTVMDHPSACVIKIRCMIVKASKSLQVMSRTRLPQSSQIPQRIRKSLLTCVAQQVQIFC